MKRIRTRSSIRTVAVRILFERSTRLIVCSRVLSVCCHLF